MVDSWLVAHALPPGITTTTLHNVSEEESGEENETKEPAKTENSTETEQQQTPLEASFAPKFNSAANSKNNSGSGTPVRKISAHEFERGGLTKPLVTTVDGAPTFLSPPQADISDVGGRGQLIRKRSQIDIAGLNETDLILELVKDICNDLDIKSLCHKILQNVGILTNADR